MKLSEILKHKSFIIIFSTVIVVVIVSVFFLPSRIWDKSSSETGPQATISTGISTLVDSPISPVSPVSPVASGASTRPDPAEIEALLHKGIAQYESQDYQEAIATFNEVLVLDPANFLAYNSRGSVYTDLKDYERAIADYTKVTELEPLFPHAYYNRGRVYSFLKKYDEALTDLQKSIELSPDEFGYRANGNIGLIYHQLGEYDKALAAFESAITYDDTKADTFYLRGETYTALENYEAAIADYQAAIARFSRYDLAYQSLGYAYYKTGQFDQALEALNQAFEISPNSPAVHFYLALVYVARNDFEEAKAETSQAMNSTDTLSEEEQKSLFTRVLADLKGFVQENPEKAKEVDTIINLIPES